MEYEVLRSFNRHVALVLARPGKKVKYIAATSTGPQIHTVLLKDFAKDFSEPCPLGPRAAALSFLGAARRAYYFDAAVISALLGVVAVSTKDTVELYNALASVLCKAPVQSFKNRTTAATAVATLEKLMNTPTVDQHANAAAKAEKAEKVKAARPPKEPKESKPRGIGLGAFCVGLIQAGKSNAEILEAVKAKWPDAKTSVSSLGWYRNNLKKKSS